ncbi:LPXTG cell wall anchor domain-containing protein [Salinicoccus bachuensis]|uniref:LPXTG cell wall anchor domain-containing protein n=1 Tax=Salinicoccus bachuensis TaxID=3136731 RepID=A0ABZ3CM69_9STAP
MKSKKRQRLMKASLASVLALTIATPLAGTVDASETDDWVDGSQEIGGGDESHSVGDPEDHVEFPDWYDEDAVYDNEGNVIYTGEEANHFRSVLDTVLANPNQYIVDGGVYTVTYEVDEGGYAYNYTIGEEVIPTQFVNYELTLDQINVIGASIPQQRSTELDGEATEEGNEEEVVAPEGSNQESEEGEYPEETPVDEAEESTESPLEDEPTEEVEPSEPSVEEESVEGSTEEEFAGGEVDEEVVEEELIEESSEENSNQEGTNEESNEEASDEAPSDEEYDENAIYQNGELLYTAVEVDHYVAVLSRVMQNPDKYIYLENGIYEYHYEVDEEGYATEVVQGDLIIPAAFIEIELNDDEIAKIGADIPKQNPEEVDDDLNEEDNSSGSQNDDEVYHDILDKVLNDRAGYIYLDDGVYEYSYDIDEYGFAVNEQVGQKVLPKDFVEEMIPGYIRDVVGTEVPPSRSIEEQENKEGYTTEYKNHITLQIKIGNENYDLDYKITKGENYKSDIVSIIDELNAENDTNYTVDKLNEHNIGIYSRVDEDAKKQIVTRNHIVVTLIDNNMPNLKDLVPEEELIDDIVPRTGQVIMRFFNMDKGGVDDTRYLETWGGTIDNQIRREFQEMIVDSVNNDAPFFKYVDAEMEEGMEYGSEVRPVYDVIVYYEAYNPSEAYLQQVEEKKYYYENEDANSDVKNELTLIDEETGKTVMSLEVYGQFFSQRLSSIIDEYNQINNVNMMVSNTELTDYEVHTDDYYYSTSNRKYNIYVDGLGPDEDNDMILPGVPEEELYDDSTSEMVYRSIRIIDGDGLKYDREYVRTETMDESIKGALSEYYMSHPTYFNIDELHVYEDVVEKYINQDSAGYGDLYEGRGYFIEVYLDSLNQNDKIEKNPEKIDIEKNYMGNLAFIDYYTGQDLGRIKFEKGSYSKQLDGYLEQLKEETGKNYRVVTRKAGRVGGGGGGGPYPGFMEVNYVTNMTVYITDEWEEDKEGVVDGKPIQNYDYLIKPLPEGVTPQDEITVTKNYTVGEEVFEDFSELYKQYETYYTGSEFTEIEVPSDMEIGFAYATSPYFIYNGFYVTGVAETPGSHSLSYYEFNEKENDLTLHNVNINVWEKGENPDDFESEEPTDEEPVDEPTEEEPTEEEPVDEPTEEEPTEEEPVDEPTEEEPTEEEPVDEPTEEEPTEEEPVDEPTEEEPTDEELTGEDNSTEAPPASEGDNEVEDDSDAPSDDSGTGTQEENETGTTIEGSSVVDEASGITVSSATGELEGVQVSVEVLEDSGLISNPHDLYDIELLDADGNEYEPEASVTVSIPANGTVSNVYYLGESGETLTELAFEVMDGYVVFTKDSFSQFAVEYGELTEEGAEEDSENATTDDDVVVTEVNSDGTSGEETTSGSETAESSEASTDTTVAAAEKNDTEQEMLPDTGIAAKNVAIPAALLMAIGGAVIYFTRRRPN